MPRPQIVYGFILSKGSKMIADGSEMLMEILNPGIIGGLVLPILGALPDAAIILVSTLGGTDAEVKEQVNVGVGTLAGSTIMLLCIPWAGGIFVGRCDIRNGVAIDRTRTKGMSLTETGVTCDDESCKGARIMMLTSLVFLIVQLPAFFHDYSKTFVLIACIVALINLVLYCVYMVMNPIVQERRFQRAREHYLKLRVLETLHHINGKQLFAPKGAGSGTGETASLLGSSTNAAPVDVKNIGLKWKTKAKEQREERDLLEAAKLESGIEGDVDIDESDDENEHAHLTKGQIAMRSSALMLFGTAVVAFFSDPMVDTISAFAKVSGIPSFYVSFIVTPFASNASELIASLAFAAKRRKKNISLTFGAIYGAVCMNSTLCVGVLLLMMYLRDGIEWDFSAEMVSLFFVIFSVGLLGQSRTTPLWRAILVISLYPMAIGIVALLEIPAIGWK